MNKKSKLKLVIPSRKYIASYMKLLDDLRKETEDVSKTSEKLHVIEDYPAYFKKLKDNSKGINLKKGRVPSTLYWALVGNSVVGHLDVRHKLNKRLRIIGGNIGYSVKPAERKKGYGTEMLRQGLKKAKLIGIKKALITCDKVNIGSKKVIEANGGKLINKIKVAGVPTLQYQIDLK
jgi:predicted acetyltransferase